MALTASLRLRARPRCPVWRRAWLSRRGPLLLRGAGAGRAFCGLQRSASLHTCDASPAVNHSKLQPALCVLQSRTTTRRASAGAMQSWLLPETNAGQISLAHTQHSACKADLRSLPCLVSLSSVYDLQRAPAKLWDCPRMPPIRPTLQISQRSLQLVISDSQRLSQIRSVLKRPGRWPPRWRSLHLLHPPRGQRQPTRSGK